MIIKVFGIKDSSVCPINKRGEKISCWGVRSDMCGGFGWRVWWAKGVSVYLLWRRGSIEIKWFTLGHKALEELGLCRSDGQEAGNPIGQGASKQGLPLQTLFLIWLGSDCRPDACDGHPKKPPLLTLAPPDAFQGDFWWHISNVFLLKQPCQFQGRGNVLLCPLFYILLSPTVMDSFNHCRCQKMTKGYWSMNSDLWHLVK